MACASISMSSSAAAAKASMHLSDSGGDLRCNLISGAKIQRSMSEPQLIRCSLIVPRAAPTATTTTTAAKMMGSKSLGMFPFNFSVPFLFDSETHLIDHEDPHLDDHETEEDTNLGEEEGVGSEKRANWVERLLELRSRWRRDHSRPLDDDEEEEQDGGEVDGCCGVGYESESEEEVWDPAKFRAYLRRAPWSETKLFSKLAFLCNMAYVIPHIKGEDLRKYYNLRLVTSSLDKKLTAAMKASSALPHPDPNGSEPAPASEPKRPIRPSVAYDIAASAASYVHSRAKGLLSLGHARYPSGGAGPAGHEPGEGVYKSEVAAMVAASTMTAVVAAEEEARLEAAEGLRSLQSSPCEWFVCDDPNTCTRCFVIQGSDSLASWQANLMFEPTKFEETEALVHRGIYEAAKGIYEQFMPEIEAHLRRHGDQAKLRFTGHSLGGSLSMLVDLMLQARGEVPRSCLLPVVTFGSPSVFCGGRRAIDELGVDEGHICSVMMHRDIVPRAFSCNYPNHVAQLLKRLNGAFRSHPCLNNEKLLYSPLGKLYILQPDEQSSPPHPLLPPGAALYSLEAEEGNISGALKAFLNSPHPLEMLSNPAAYGSEGTILRDHESSNYLKAINGLIRQHTNTYFRRSRKQKLKYLWPLTSTTWNVHRESGIEKPGFVPKEVVTGA